VLPKVGRQRIQLVQLEGHHVDIPRSIRREGYISDVGEGDDRLMTSIPRVRIGKLGFEELKCPCALHVLPDHGQHVGIAGKERQRTIGVAGAEKECQSSRVDRNGGRHERVKRSCTADADGRGPRSACVPL
jgi:hypothetical protein